jgi:hypothetical protein
MQVLSAEDLGRKLYTGLSNIELIWPADFSLVRHKKGKDKGLEILLNDREETSQRVSSLKSISSISQPFDNYFCNTPL